MASDEQNEDVEAFLVHFGVKGMRWGIRKEPIERSSEERIIEKGTKLQTVTAGKVATAGDRRMFTSHTEKDNLAYRSTYARTLQYMSNDADIYTNSLVANKNLKVASDKVAYDEFKKLYDADPPAMIKAIAESHAKLTQLIIGFDDKQTAINAEHQAEVFTKKAKKGEAWLEKNGYDLFTTGTGTDLFNRNIADSYYSALGKLGYDAIVDNTDVKAKMADDPIVILKPNASVKVKSTVPLTETDIKLASKLYKEKKKSDKAAKKGGS